MIDYSSFEIVVSGNEINQVMVMQDNKLKPIDIMDITDQPLIDKIMNLNSYLKIYPLGEYVFDKKEFYDFRQYILEKRYLMKCSQENPLIKRLQKKGVI